MKNRTDQKTSEDVQSSEAYWTTGIQIALYNCAVKFMEEKGMNSAQLAEYLGESKRCVSKLLSGDFNYNLERLVKISMKLGYVPIVEFKPLEEIKKQG